ncbi:N-acetyltransferase family 8 member 3-like isoform X2 [Strigops habroptila]|uniref:N-acetyltransferase family 8 member 3-like isoform X2 n=1 Tax=Strigops habroptila TaxID=2489341 RepID=UPI0011CF82F9|nr:N-acetyltransferase family 8 member 3-like isoform X2 [Strigops habroptila]XP_030348219.1 N-acetyltransferase family 8 member 3-like isoform X2 [Strigops habroptila]
MASYRIRQYQDKDFDAVRTLFARGMLEHMPAGYRHVLRSARVQLELLVLFVLQALSTDLADVHGTYLRSPHSCFWVAEVGGAVVGMVAVEPPEDPAEREVALELKRMSVSKEHRGWGISGALCGEVLRFTRARGFGAVVLSTSMVQVAAQRLYESQGFRKVGATSPGLLASLLCFQIFRYRCDLPGRAAAPPH